MTPDPSSYRARGTVLVQVAVVLTVLLGFVALTIDTGRMYNTRADLVNAADAGAMAAAQFYTSDTGRAIRNGTYLGDSAGATRAETRRLAGEIVYENYALGGVRLRVNNDDIVPGWFDMENPQNPLRTDVPVDQFNAVEVTVWRSDASANGAVELLFARIFGKETVDVGARAIAGFDDRFAGYRPSGPTSPLTPFVVQEDVFEQLLIDGPDELSYDSDLETVYRVGDDLPEVHLFPLEIETADNRSAGAGNFGTLNVGIVNQGTSALGAQIESGISLEDLETEIGTSDLSFVSDAGDPITYNVTGNPGLSAGVEPYIQARVGDIIGFFLYSNVSGGGADATYTITGLRFGRLLEVDLTTSNEARRVVVQPIAYTDPNVVVSELAPSTNGLIGRLMLLR